MKKIEAKNKRQLLGLAVILALYLAILLLQLGKPLLADEFIFLKGAKSIMERGIPIGYDSDEDLLKGNTNLPIGHPTTYMHYLALMLSIGLPENFIRATSVAVGLLNIIVLFFLAKLIFKNKEELVLLTLAVYVIMPLTLQSSLLIEIDNTLLTFTSLIFVYVFLQLYEKLTIRNTAILAGVFAMVMATRFNLGPAILLSTIIFLAAKKSKNSVRAPFAIVAAGFAIFLAGWYAYTSALSLPFWYPITTNLVQTRLNTDLWTYLMLKVLYGGIKINVFWLTPALFLLLCMAILPRVDKYLKRQKIFALDFIVIYAALIFIEHMFVGQSAWRFPKYIAPALPLFAIIAADTIMWARKFFERNKILVSMAFVLTIAYYAIFLRDPLIHVTSAIEVVKIGILYMIPLVIVSACFIWKGMGFEGKKVFISAFAVVFLSTAVYLDYQHLTADYSTLYNYGQAGLKDVLKFLDGKVTKGEWIETWAGEVAYYSGTKYYLFFGPYNECKAELEKRGTRYSIIFKDWEYRYRPEFIKCMDKNYKRQDFGNYAVYSLAD